ncbi:SDR family oxidoreductase [Robertkochia solimangrovi]|uniref:SDR family oxidoreductase n=1 Tax=Robertkochia solimangrovi TaxID=2213046 RepID=UPI001180B58D|nr:SDR family oxidoreductase [Robertkochia solimangrovi]TRZ46297.1 NAD-dependent epimerase [Robertkochia solimangrovi]
MILVTGGTGLVGAQLLVQLLEKEDAIRATYRSEEKLEETLSLFSQMGVDKRLSAKIEWIQANLNDIPSLQKAFINVMEVYHCAALVSFDPSRYHELRRTNIDGTANVINCAIHSSVRKLCYVSSVATLDKALGETEINEESHWNPEEDHNVYAITKYGAEMEVWRGSQEGLQVLIFNPGIVLGEATGINSSNRFFDRIKSGLNFYPPGGTGWVDARDIAKVMIAGMKSNLSNKRFILVSENRSYYSVLKSIADSLGKRVPANQLTPFMLHILRRLDWLRSRFSNSERMLTRHMVRSAKNNSIYSGRLVTTALPFEYTKLDDTINRVAEFHTD